MTSLEYYDYQEWVGWPESDIREYAGEIAVAHALTAAEAEHLEAQMTQRAGFRIESARRAGPFKMDAEMEAMFRSMGNGDAEVAVENHRLNRPYTPPKYVRETRHDSVGAGLTKRHVEKVVRQSRWVGSRIRQARKGRASSPFASMNAQILGWAEDAMWLANCYPINRGDWLSRKDSEAPREGLAWYARELTNAYYNARDQARDGNTEAALLHAFRAGSLRSEMEVRIAHGRTFDKYEAVSIAQRDAAQAHRKQPDEERREAYRQHLCAGDKPIEAAQNAANDLCVSVATIRRAFSENRLPKRPEDF